MTDDTTMADFSRKEPPKPPIKFRIDADVFECTSRLPAGGTRKLMELATAQESENFAQVLQRLGEFIDIVMLPSSKDRFLERLNSATEPIDDEQVGNIAVFVIESYGEGLRPTVPSSSSANGLGDGGASTTATAPTEG